jgi:hypothetical protein
MKSWNEWVQEGRKDRRRLVIQVINALRLTYSWQSFEKAIANLEMMNITPEGSPEAIKQAVELCSRLNWNASEIRKDFR